MKTCVLVALAGSAVLCGAASAGGLVVTEQKTIWTKIATSPTSIVPGAQDLAGAPAVTNFRALEDLIMSPDGSKWVVKGRTQQGADSETILLMGSGLSGTMFAQEGRPVHGGVAGELYDFFGSSLGAGRFNTLNQFAYSARARGGVSSVFQKVIRWDGVNFTIPFQMGSLITGLVDTTVSGDETFGNSVGSVHLLDNGTIGTQDSTIGNINALRRPAIMYNQAAFHQTNVTTVTNLAGSGVELWKTIFANTFYTSPDGAHWIAGGQVNQPTTNDEVLVVDGKVVMQEGLVIPGTGVTMNAVFNNDIKSNGDWYARGDSPGGNDWAIRNGTLIAKTGDSVEGGSESWGAVFSAFNINRTGGWVLAGITDSTNPGANEVITVNGNVVLREGDPIDVDGNGLFDDDAFVGRGNNVLSAFEPNDFALTDDMYLYCFVTLHNAAGQDLNSTPAFGTPQAFIRLKLAVPPPPCPMDLDHSGVIDTPDLVALLGNFGGSVPPFTGGDFDGDGDVDTVDLVALLGEFGNPCPV